MEVIFLEHPYDKDQLVQEPIVLALGFFDGVHLGHRAVIQRAKKEAEQRQLKLAVLTFNQHPKLVYTDIHPDEIDYLTTNARKKELLEELGVDILYLMDFTLEFGTQTPQSFVDHYIAGIHAKVVVAGYDYTYGKKELANMQTLPEHARNRFEVIEVSELTIGSRKVGSSNIRDLIASGQIKQANYELGYVYETSGVVVHGEKRGRMIGYPTANIDTTVGEMLPGKGIYVVECYVGGQWYKGMASIGYNITFETKTGLTCEIHILDFDRMIYGEMVRVRWHHYLRSEVKFNGVEGLIQQLDKDQVDTRNFFEQREAE